MMLFVTKKPKLQAYAWKFEPMARVSFPPLLYTYPQSTQGARAAVSRRWFWAAAGWCCTRHSLSLASASFPPRDTGCQTPGCRTRSGTRTGSSRSPPSRRQRCAAVSGRTASCWGQSPVWARSPGRDTAAGSPGWTWPYGSGYAAHRISETHDTFIS